MTKVLTIIGVMLVAGGLAYHFAALEIFNALVPKDAGSRLVAQDVAYGADKRQKLDVYAPIEGQGPWPVVVFVHGGSWQEGNKNPYEFVGRALASQGMLAMVINYRLHPQNPYPAFVDDTAKALNWATDNAVQFGGDSKRLFAMGHSAGAYNVAMAVLTRHTPGVKAVVTLAGPFDFLPLDSRITIEVFGKVTNLPETQPVNHVSAAAPPFLILHGKDDTTVYPRNAPGLQKRFEAAGAQATIKLYDNMGHVGILMALSKARRNAAPVLADAVAFMKDKSR